MARSTVGITTPQHAGRQGVKESPKKTASAESRLFCETPDNLGLDGQPNRQGWRPDELRCASHAIHPERAACMTLQINRKIGGAVARIATGHEIEHIAFRAHDRYAAALIPKKARQFLRLAVVNDAAGGSGYLNLLQLGGQRTRLLRERLTLLTGCRDGLFLEPLESRLFDLVGGLGSANFSGRALRFGTFVVFQWFRNRGKDRGFPVPRRQRRDSEDVDGLMAAIVHAGSLLYSNSRTDSTWRER
jgi:hypothetical protein